MPTKLSLTLGKPRALSRETAWGCFTTNLALPGCGSLFAGKRIGYAQFFFTAIGFVLTMVFGVGTLIWYTREYSRLQEMDDMFEKFHELWLHLRWALLGMAFFFFALVWALFTSREILAEAKKAAPPELSKPRPPLLKR